MPLSYGIQTITAPTSQIEGIISWTVDEMIDYVGSNLADGWVFYPHNKSAVLDICLRANGKKLIDMENNLFDHDLFVKMLDFANQFTPDHIYTYGSVFDHIRDNKIVLRVANIQSITIVQLVLNEFVEMLAFPGYPTETGGGNLAHSNVFISMNQQSSNKEAGWAFINSMLTDDFQRYFTSFIGLPIRKSALRAQARVNREGIITFAGSDIELEIYPATENEMQILNDLIESVSQTSFWDEQIYKFILEEAQFYFNGDKTAIEVAMIIQNRISIYLSETD